MTEIKAHTYDEPSLMSLSKMVANHMQRVTQCCPNCEHFDIKRETCGANNHQRPPAHIIAFACPAFVLNDCPF